jgi:hypothetical protein
MTGISDETYDRLRRILEKQNGHPYAFEEAKVIGDELLGFYASLIDIQEKLG